MTSRHKLSITTKLFILIVTAIAWLTYVLLLISPDIWTLESWQYLTYLRTILDVYFIISTIWFFQNLYAGRVKATRIATVSVFSILFVIMSAIVGAFSFNIYEIQKDLAIGHKTYIGNCYVYADAYGADRPYKAYMVTQDEKLTVEISGNLYNELSGQNVPNSKVLLNSEYRTPNYNCNTVVRINYTENYRHILKVEKY